MIRITSKVDGFRRAGIAHSCQPQTYPDDHFSPAQLSALQAEPNLVVQVIGDWESEPTHIHSTALDPKGVPTPSLPTLVPGHAHQAWDASDNSGRAEQTATAPATVEPADAATVPDASTDLTTAERVDPAPVAAPKSDTKTAPKGKAK